MRSSTIILSTLLLGVTVYAGFLFTENRRLKEAADSSQTEIQLVLETDSVGLGENETQVISSEGADAALQKDVQALQVEPAQASERAQRENRHRQRMERMAAQFDNPEMRADMIERQMNQIDSRYSGFFRSLDLNRDEIETLRLLMAESNLIGWETRMQLFASDGEADAARIEAETDARREMLRAGMEEILGDAGVALLDEYSESIPYRREVESLADSLSYSDTPLSETQSEQLVRAIQSVSSQFEYTKDLSTMRRRDYGDLSETEVALYFSERAERDAMIIDAAASALGEEQLAAFAERQIADRERDQRQMEFMLENGMLRGHWGRGR